MHRSSPLPAGGTVMKRLLPIALGAVVLVAVVVLLVSGGGDGAAGGSASASPYGSSRPPGGAGGATQVRTARTTLGTVLVDARGRTLYLFEEDTTAKSTCTGACASIWPPLTSTGPVTAGPGVDAAKLGSSRRSDGTNEVTYAGHPLYTYTGDGKAGDTTGQGLDQFGAEWYVLAPTGQKIDED